MSRIRRSLLSGGRLFLQASWETSFLCLDHDLCQPSGEYDEIEAKGRFKYITRIVCIRPNAVCMYIYILIPSLAMTTMCIFLYSVNIGN